jgi:hypothetical protein
MESPLVEAGTTERAPDRGMKDVENASVGFVLLGLCKKLQRMEFESLCNRDGAGNTAKRNMEVGK